MNPWPLILAAFLSAFILGYVFLWSTPPAWWMEHP